MTRADDQYASPRERIVVCAGLDSGEDVLDDGNGDYDDEDSEATLIKFKNLSYALGDRVCFPDLKGAIDQAKRMDTLDNNEANMEGKHHLSTISSHIFCLTPFLTSSLSLCSYHGHYSI